MAKTKTPATEVKFEPSAQGGRRSLPSSPQDCGPLTDTFVFGCVFSHKKQEDVRRRTHTRQRSQNLQQQSIEFHEACWFKNLCEHSSCFMFAIKGGRAQTQAQEEEIHTRRKAHRWTLSHVHSARTRRRTVRHGHRQRHAKTHRQTSQAR